MFRFPLPSALIAATLLILGVACTNPIGQTSLDTTPQDTTRSFVTGAFLRNYSTVYFRGTPNNWTTTPMVLVGDHTWEVSAYFGYAPDQRFKFDITGNWSQNFGDTNGDFIAEPNGSDILISAPGSYIIQFNDVNKLYKVSPSVEFDCYTMPDRTSITSEWDLAGLTLRVYESGSNRLMREGTISSTTSHGTYASVRSPGIVAGTYIARVDQVMGSDRYFGETTFTIVDTTSPSPGFTISKEPAYAQFDVYALPADGAYLDSELNGLVVALRDRNGNIAASQSLVTTATHGTYADFRNLNIISGIYTAEINTLKEGYLYSCSQSITVGANSPSPSLFVQKSLPAEFKKTYNQVYFRSTWNNWGATPMALVSDYTWRIVIPFHTNAVEKFKFDVNGDWAINFGDTNKDLVAEQNGADISVTPNTNWEILFNDQTKVYSLLKK